MTSILVVSDSHGRGDLLRRIADISKGRFDRVIHLGDGYRDILEFQNELPHLNTVQGNMDSLFSLAGGDPENTLEIVIDGVKILAVHGHQFRVHNTLNELMLEAGRTKAKLVLFGHTHDPFLQKKNGITYFNPGAVKFGSYGLVTLDAGKVVSAGHESVKS